ncbi:hypothetical protein UCDDS831_g04907 [Diplodia seriata]|uniref:Uncharacterized protein n=1 Tax=Diplodia seriata TaxID=420778 RepID=A0A0G2G9C4_9PEZI|nr:hypothetical protein UCDDS831_g04907 [Diplodia seriata]
MPKVSPHEAEAFISDLRTKATNGVKHFANLPHYAGSTKTAIALTLLAYTAGKRDGLKPRSDQLVSMTNDLNWTKYELAKRELEQDDVIKKLHVDLRWANFQLAKKNDKDREIQTPKTGSVLALQDSERKKENEAPSADGSNGISKMTVSQKHTIAMHDEDVYRLKEQLEHERSEKVRYKELFESRSLGNISQADLTNKDNDNKLRALEEAFNVIEQGLIAENKHLRSKLAGQPKNDAISKTDKDYTEEQRQYNQEAQKEIERLKSENENERIRHDKKVKSISEQTLSLKAENDKLSMKVMELTSGIQSLMIEKELDIQGLQQQLSETQGKLASMSQSMDNQSAHMKIICQMESKLANFANRAKDNEQRMKKDIRNLREKLSTVGPLTRFIEERDFSDEQRLPLSWEEMTYAMRAAASGLSPQVQRFLPAGCYYIVQETLKGGSTDLVQFSKQNPGRFVLQYEFFEAVAAVVENILWETQKFHGVRNQQNNDSLNIQRALRERNV